MLRSDDTIAAFDATNPSTQNFGDAAAVGVATFAARRDHAHAWPSVAASRLTLGVRNYLGVSLIANPIAESIPHYQMNINASLLNTGRASGVLIPVLNGDVLTSLSFISATTALSAGTHWWFALVDSALNVIRQSTDQLTAAWGANTVKTLACDSIPVTAGSRSGTTTVTLTFPTLSQALTSIITAGDSIVVSNANIAAYNGTFTVATVSATQITYICGGSATDSLAAPFPTVQLAAGKRTYTVAADGYVYAILMVAATVPTIGAFNGFAAATGTGYAPVFSFTGQTSLTGTCPSPVTQTAVVLIPWSAVS